MHMIKRAIIMAAGKGERMRPVTLKTPKPLVKVNGERMIDTIIHGLQSNGIWEIYVVVGYLKEMFLSLEKKYSGLKLIENPYFDTCNNISSLYVVRDYLEEAIILDGDQMIYNDKVLAAEFEKSSYNCIWSEDTSEWLLEIEDGLVKSCSKNGGRKGWQLYSISRWTKKDGKKLKEHLEFEFEIEKNHQIYWDEIPLFCHAMEYQLGIMRMEPGDVIEIDSLEELAILDRSYRKEILKWQGENG